ncbi:MAG: hypothetical protein ACOY45_06465 [Pseudomonadota bacterium]
MRVYDITAPTPQGPALHDQQAFLIGVDFHEAAVRSSLTEHDPLGAPIVALCPMIVCYAFAAELYLKSLMPRRRKGHKLNMLFAHVPVDAQGRIAQQYTDRTGRDRTALEGDLKAFAKAFEEWRYIFEGEGQQLRVNLLIAFTKAVYETARELQPTWIVRDYLDQRLRADAAEPTMTVANLGGGTFLHVIDGTGGLLNKPDA